jgi:hypothetical protein
MLVAHRYMQKKEHTLQYEEPPPSIANASLCPNSSPVYQCSFSTPSTLLPDIVTCAKRQVGRKSGMRSICAHTTFFLVRWYCLVIS